MIAHSEDAQHLLQAHEEMQKSREHNDLLGVMSTPEGRRFVWDLIVRAGVFEPSFSGDSQLMTAFREGQRSVGIDLFERVKLETTDLYITALNEQLVEQRKATDLRKAAQAEAEHNQERDSIE